MEQGSETLASLEVRLGYTFSDPSLLLEALTHSSFSDETGTPSYERLEFLGDAVLGLATARLIFDAFPDLPEGVMTKFRAAVVNQTHLAAVGRSLGMANHVRLGKGGEKEGIRERDSVVSDVVESILGAVFVDGGWEPAERLIRREWYSVIEGLAESEGTTDPRSRLQELLQKTQRSLTFTYQQSGPDHAVEFTATALVDGDPVGYGSGVSKKAAAGDAARNALEEM